MVTALVSLILIAFVTVAVADIALAVTGNVALERFLVITFGAIAALLLVFIASTAPD